jgi:hypothetical protein
MDDLLAKLRGEGDHETYAPATEDDLLATEQSLGRPLPPSFRAFQRGFSNGAYLFMVQEVSSVGVGNPQIGAIQNVLPNVIEASPETDVALDSGGTVKAAALVPFSLDHNGNSWCFLTSEGAPDGEYPVAYYDADHEKLYGRLSGFRAWLEALAGAQDEVIRTLYDSETLEGEMGLG